MKILSAIGIDMETDNGAVEVHPSAILQWIPMAGNKKHDVYFGTDATEVANADINTVGIYQGRQDVAEITFDPYGVDWMDWSATYYWRIDEVIEGTPDTIYLGVVWSFTTIVPVCSTPPIGDTNGDCLVTLEEVVDIAESWLSCGLEPVESCPL